MFPQDQLPWPACEKKADLAEAAKPYDTADLEMWPQAPDAGETRFRDAVREAAIAAGGELLFDLPADGLVADRLRIAVARIPDNDEKMRVVLATLDQDGAEIHLQMPDAATAHLVGFANAFVGLFHRISDPEQIAAQFLPPLDLLKVA
jgi:hypothetical protein